MPPETPGSIRGAGRVRTVLAVGFGSGFSPIASGTAGSVVALPLIWVAVRYGGWPALAVLAAVTSVVGVWAADAVARAVGRSDPGIVVIDEIAGQMVTMLFVPLTWQTLAAGFLLFRLADILKPFPARRSEELPGGFGIMVDDLIAGVYANLAVQALVWLLPSRMGMG
ncbi:MAG: phosphatidylglycerophosphatase A [Acidobacteriota bacterium]|nr:phosphatidylglycerophosphatase A [Acidobacteriota bacterium]